MNTKCKLIENVSPIVVKPRSVLIPVIGIIVCGAALYWIGNHVYGGCVGLNDVFTYCQIQTK